MTKEALKLALEYVELVPDDRYNAEHIDREALVTAIKEALAQPEQEPVTWRYKIVDVFGRPAWTLKTPKSDTRVLESQPLYTNPPQRKPLSDEEKQAMWSRTKVYLTPKRSYFQGIADSEAAHQIKGEA